MIVIKTRNNHDVRKEKKKAAKPEKTRLQRLLAPPAGLEPATS